jgi:hypothetical protein
MEWSMDNIERRKNAANALIEVARQKGFISIDEIMSISEEFKLDVIDIDRVTEDLILKGIIITDELSIKKSENEKTYGKAQIDYNKVFNKVIKLDPSLKA